MPSGKTEKQEFQPDLESLDALISKCYNELMKAKSLKAKLGDFVKMIALRYKLAPANADQKKLWQMLEDIRRNGLPSDKATKNAPPEAKSTHSKGRGKGKS